MTAEGLVAPAVPRASAWSPLRHSTFRALWIAQFASNVGTWMQIVGAQWLMGDLGGRALAVALVQTASSLPVFLFVLPAGALGDILDRRRLLLGSQAAMLASSACLAALTFAGATTPVLLLGLVFVLGLGQALTRPTFQAVQPELVAREEIPQAATLNGVNFNVARAVGPAIGGLAVAAAGPGVTFALNSLSFVAVLAVLVWWRRPASDPSRPAEHVWQALSAGGRFVRSAPNLRVVLIRAGLFVMGASALWALLPVVARESLRLGSGGYGLLLGSVGVGAVSGAFVLPPLRERLGLNVVVGLASTAFAGSCLILGLVHVVVPVVVALVVAGLAWLAVLTSLNASAQTLLPNWTRARGLAYYTLMFTGGQALGSTAWGALAQSTTPAIALTAAAGTVLATALVGLRLRLVALDIDLDPARHGPAPHIAVDPDPATGPVLVTVAYHVAPERAEDFLRAMGPVERARRRTGARRWSLFQDGSDPTLFLETYVVATWEEHRRQHDERVTKRDAELEQHARSLVMEGTEPRVGHLFTARPGGEAPLHGRPREGLVAGAPEP